MALNKTDLENQIKEMLTQMLTREETSIDEFASKLSNSIYDFVKSADVKYNNGLSAPNGPVTGTFNGRLE